MSTYAMENVCGANRIALDDALQPAGMGSTSYTSAELSHLSAKFVSQLTSISRALGGDSQVAPSAKSRDVFPVPGGEAANLDGSSLIQVAHAMADLRKVNVATMQVSIVTHVGSSLKAGFDSLYKQAG